MSHLRQNPVYKFSSNEDKKKEKIKYSEEENSTWSSLYNVQILNLRDLASNRVLECLAELSLPKNHIPQLDEVSERLYKKTGWKVFQVGDLIDGDTFFQLLNNKMFPSTIYIRSRTAASLTEDADISHSKDPDIFHELFGHCPLLLDMEYANLFKKFGQIGLHLDKVQRMFFQRLFWFTFETGLVCTPLGLKIYGGSLLSSIKESRYAIKNPLPIRQEFNMINIFRTSYRADLIQSIYYVALNLSQFLAMLNDVDLIKKNIEIAYESGEFPPLFPIEERYSKYISYNICKFIKEKNTVNIV